MIDETKNRLGVSTLEPRDDEDGNFHCLVSKIDTSKDSKEKL